MRKYNEPCTAHRNRESILLHRRPSPVARPDLRLENGIVEENAPCFVIQRRRVRRQLLLPNWLTQLASGTAVLNRLTDATAQRGRRQPAGNLPRLFVILGTAGRTGPAWTLRDQSWLTARFSGPLRAGTSSFVALSGRVACSNSHRPSRTITASMAG